jgi:hypothetical protein
MEKKIDETIENICSWIDSNLEKVSIMDNSQIMTNMVIALADLVSARASLD